MKLKRTSKAEELYDQGFNCSGERRYDEAVEKFKESLEIKQDYVPSLFGLGSALLFLGKYGEAIESLKHFLEICPSYTGMVLDLFYNWLDIKDKQIKMYKSYYESEKN